jgi:hypothetical protein
VPEHRQATGAQAIPPEGNAQKSTEDEGLARQVRDEPFGLSRGMG